MRTSRTWWVEWKVKDGAVSEKNEDGIHSYVLAVPDSASSRIHFSARCSEIRFREKKKDEKLFSLSLRNGTFDSLLASSSLGSFESPIQPTAEQHRVADIV